MRYNLSEITALIKDRRTIFPEQYSKRKVHKEQVEQILNNAIWAPTHGKTQPWRFKVFMNESREQLADFLSDWYVKNTPEEQFNTVKFKRMQDRPIQASAIIVVCMERQKEEKISELDEIMATACAVQNMYLTCSAIGLGAFWSTPKLMQSEEMKSFLHLEAKDKCLGLFYIGYPEIEWPKGQRRPIEYVTEWR